MNKTNAEIRARGEQHVIAELRRRGIEHQLEPRGRRNDILVTLAQDVVTVQVRVTSQGQRRGWLLTKELERATDDRLLYAFVDTEPAVPETFFIPAAVVSDVLRTSHEAWLDTRGRGGRPHRDNPMRMMLSDYGIPVQGYPAGWLERYRERWDLMQGAGVQAEDPVLANFVAAVEGDPDTLGVLLHGSRASGQPRDDSDYDLIRIVTQEAYDARLDRGQVIERVTLGDGMKGDVLYQTPSRIETYVSTPGWYTATYLAARVAFDRSGDIRAMLARMRTEADRIAHENTATAYDGYLNSFVRSMKSARRGDELGQRLHSAESALALIRTLFGLESTWPPYHDGLDPALHDVEQAQGWPAGYLSMALSRLVGDADASFQQLLEDRVERLMTSRRVLHEWGDDLKPLKALRFDTKGSVV